PEPPPSEPPQRSRPLAEELRGGGRVAIAGSVLGAVALAIAAALFLHVGQLRGGHSLWPWAPLAGISGLLLALSDSRMRGSSEEWTQRITRRRPMQRPTVRMWTLWMCGIGSVAAASYGITRGSVQWPLAAWGAGLILLVGGALQPPVVVPKVRWS